MQMQADVGLLGIDVRPLQACRAKAIDDRVLEFQSREMRVGDTRRATGDFDRETAAGREHVRPLDGLRRLVDRLCIAELERSDEHTCELQSLMRISYAGLCFEKKRKLNPFTSHLPLFSCSSPCLWCLELCLACFPRRR